HGGEAGRANAHGRGDAGAARRGERSQRCACRGRVGPPRMSTAGAELARLTAAVLACRICRDRPLGRRLPHEPRPVLRPSATARVLVASQAPGARVHASGIPFTDPSGERLRAWLAVTAEEFYDPARIAIVPMGFCFPGHDAAGGDLPPRPECALTWHGR